MKLRVEIDGQARVLDSNIAGASVMEVMPGVYSILLGSRSVTVHAVARGAELEIAIEDQMPRAVSVADVRDRSGSANGGGAKGPATVRAQMPGKIVTLLVEPGAAVEAGQGLIVVEAMKMQNEVKSPKAGKVTKVLVTPGSTVAAGETLLVVE